MAENHRLLMDDFAPGAGVGSLAELGQVHGCEEHVVGPEGPGHEVHGHLHGIGDGLVSARPGVTLSVRAAAQALAAQKAEQPAGPSEEERESVPAGARQEHQQRPALQFDDDDLDVPDFLK
jgi:hypothetical protein